MVFKCFPFLIVLLFVQHYGQLCCFTCVVWEIILKLEFEFTTPLPENSVIIY